MAHGSFGHPALRSTARGRHAHAGIEELGPIQNDVGHRPSRARRTLELPLMADFATDRIEVKKGAGLVGQASLFDD